MIKIDGIGPDAEIVVNENGGKQSKAIGRFDLIDPLFLYGYFENYHRLASYITDYLDGKLDIETVISNLCYDNKDSLIMIAKTMEYGATRYPKDNWRKISEQDHINHAIAHLVALEFGDEQDDHLAHFYTRLMMAYAVHNQGEI